MTPESQPHKDKLHSNMPFSNLPWGKNAIYNFIDETKTGSTKKSL